MNQLNGICLHYLCCLGISVENPRSPSPTLVARVTWEQVMDGAKKYAVSQ